MLFCVMLCCEVTYPLNMWPGNCKQKGNYMDFHGTAGISRETKNQRSETNMARDPGPLLLAAWAQRTQACAPQEGKGSNYCQHSFERSPPPPPHSLRFQQASERLMGKSQISLHLIKNLVYHGTHSSAVLEERSREAEGPALLSSRQTLTKINLPLFF